MIKITFYIILQLGMFSRDQFHFCVFSTAHQKKCHQSNSKVLFWISERLTFNLHRDTDLCLSNSVNPLVSVFSPFSCLPCLLNIKVFQSRKYHLQDFCSTQNTGPLIFTLIQGKWLISRYFFFFAYYNEKKFSILKRQLG